MKYSVYTDGSAMREGSSAIVGIICTENRFINSFKKEVKCENSYEAEVMAIYEALTYVAKLDGVDEVSIFTDNQRCVFVLKKLIESGELSSTNIYWKKIKELLSGMKLSVKHIKAHQVRHNMNKTCDMLARLVQTRTEGEGDKCTTQ